MIDDGDDGGGGCLLSVPKYWEEILDRQTARVRLTQGRQQKEKKKSLEIILLSLFHFLHSVTTLFLANTRERPLKMLLLHSWASQQQASFCLSSMHDQIPSEGKKLSWLEEEEIGGSPFILFYSFFVLSFFVFLLLLLLLLLMLHISTDLSTHRST